MSNVFFVISNNFVISNAVRYLCAKISPLHYVPVEMTTWNPFRSDVLHAILNVYVMSNNFVISNAVRYLCAKISPLHSVPVEMTMQNLFWSK